MDYDGHTTPPIENYLFMGGEVCPQIMFCRGFVKRTVIFLETVKYIRAVV